MSESILLKRASSDDPDFVNLVEQLNAELAIIDGEDHAFYSQYNGLDSIKHTIIAYQNEQPVACGALKKHSNISMEIKRMYTATPFRSKGLASRIIEELENWAKELSQAELVLETGKRQEDAMALYLKNGYTLTPNFGPYVGVENSCCFRKKL